ncbi:MAG TPA: tlde1 domain-containing protein [Candidatus Acidoferrales bacterium]|nr:tlde1 domain-containing protein [Candidatus Acidoferrales bacterium]
MWLYEQSTGKLLSTESVFVACGYSGAGAGKNNPAMESVRELGPIPQGIYAIGAPFDSLEHGPFAMRLAPDAANEMFGRSGFLMHGDSREHPGCASRGCIILPLEARRAVAASADRELRVLSGLNAISGVANSF